MPDQPAAASPAPNALPSDGRLRRLAIALICGLAFLMPHSTADACSDLSDWRYDKIMTDAPDCVSFGPASPGSGIFQVNNFCDQPLTLELESCKPDDCETTSFEIEVEEFRNVETEKIGWNREDFLRGDPFELNWNWSLPDNDGYVRTTGHFDDSTPSCPRTGGCLCTTPDQGAPPFPTELLLLGAIGLIGRHVGQNRR